RNITGSEAYAPPVDSGPANRLRADGGEVYVDLRAAGATPDEAKQGTVKTLQDFWGASPIDNTMVRLPPQKYYPEVGGKGNYSYMQTQVADAIEAKNRSDPDFQETEPRRFVYNALVSDRVTEDDIARGVLPRYQIIVTNTDTGAKEPLKVAS